MFFFRKLFACQLIRKGNVILGVNFDWQITLIENTAIHWMCHATVYYLWLYTVQEISLFWL